MNWIVVVSLIGAAQGCFIAYLVLAHGRQKAANLWLGLYVAAFAALCLGDALSHSSLVLRYPDLAALFDFCIFLLGPLLYQYVRVLTGRRSLGAVLWVHLIPALLVLFVIVLFHLLPLEVKRSSVASAAQSRSQLDAFTVLAAIQILAYLIAALQLLRSYGERLKQKFSAIEKRSFTWLGDLLLVNCALWLIWAIGVGTHSRIATALDYLGFPLAAYVLAAFALRAPEVLVAADDGVSSIPAEENPLRNLPAETPGRENEASANLHGSSNEADMVASGKYQKSRLPEQILRRYEAKLTRLMREEKPYLENELTLPQLARQLAIPSHHLSQLLNEHLGISFFDYVNQFRVEEVQRLLRDPGKADRSILDLAFEAGFSSKSTFNSIFKRATGHSPSAYRKLSPFPSVSDVRQASSPIGPDDIGNASV